MAPDQAAARDGDDCRDRDRALGPRQRRKLAAARCPIVGKRGMHAAIATPIVVEGRYWGVTLAATSRTTSRTAPSDGRRFHGARRDGVANAQADQELRELADTQAALRRLAMLIARANHPKRYSRPRPGRRSGISVTAPPG